MLFREEHHFKITLCRGQVGLHFSGQTKERRTLRNIANFYDLLFKATYIVQRQ